MTLYQNTHYIQNTKQEYVSTATLLTSTNMTMIYKLTTACLHNCNVGMSLLFRIVCTPSLINIYSVVMCKSRQLLSMSHVHISRLHNSISMSLFSISCPKAKHELCLPGPQCFMELLLHLCIPCVYPSIAILDLNNASTLHLPKPKYHVSGLFCYKKETARSAGSSQESSSGALTGS